MDTTKRLEKLDSQITDNEISYLSKDCYLRLKRVLAGRWVEAPGFRKDIEAEIKLLEEANKNHV